MGRHLSLRYTQVILVSRYPVLTAVNWLQHWCPICVHYQFSCALKLARKYEIEHFSWSIKTINWSADSFQINHVTSMSWHISPQYGHVILVSGHPVLTAVNWPFCECPICKNVDLPRHDWDTPPYLLIVSPTPHLQSVDAYVRTCVLSVNHVATKQKVVDHILWVWGSVPRALHARGSPATNRRNLKSQIM